MTSGIDGLDLDLPVEDRLTEAGDEAEVQVSPYSVSSYGADYPVESLVGRIRKGDVYVPEFQRGFVWDIRDASRFIESLVLGLPVPGIFLSKEPDTGKLLVVDGQQRLYSLRYFYDGKWPPSNREFALKGVQPALEGRTYAKLRPEDRRRLDDAILHATVFKEDEPSEDERGIYEVFSRLNAGGKLLTPQEVRNAIYHSGRIRQILAELNDLPEWRRIYGRAEPDLRLRDQELILRFLALHFDGGNYAKPMVDFLNRYMSKCKNPAPGPEEAMKGAFRDAIGLIAAAVGERAFRPVRALNAAVFDAVMVGVAERLRHGEVADRSALKVAYEGLITDPGFLDACGRGTASLDRVKLRLDLARTAFAGVK